MTSPAKLRLATVNVNQWENAKEQDNKHKVAKFVQDHSPDILCLQGCGERGLEEFLPLVRQDLEHVVSFKGCAVLSRFCVREYHEGFKTAQAARHVTAEINMVEGAEPIYITSVHLGHKQEANRLLEEDEIHQKLTHLFATNAAQIWAGDFNSLTRQDYEEAAWNHLAKVRESNGWEGPQVSLTDKVKKVRGMRDCWAEVGSPDRDSLCKHYTRIAYVYATNYFLGRHRLLGAEHVMDPASHHCMVLADFEMATTVEQN